MKALRFENNRLSLDEVSIPDVPGEALIRVSISGICNTDLEIVRGYADFSGTIGHEFVGVVESCPEAPEWIGRRVVGEINAGCGICEKCLAGDPRHCAARTVLGIHSRDGAHAEFVSLPSENLLEVPGGVSDEQAVFVEPLAAALGITEQIDVGRDTKVAVIGDGKLGLLCAFVMAQRSDRVTLFGKHDDKLALAARRGIATENVVTGAPELSGFDVVVEASGSESGLRAAVALVRARGTIVLKSTFGGPTNVELWRIVVDEISIVGSRCGRFGPALEMLAAGEIEVRDLIAERFPLEEGVAAMDRAATKGVLKVLIEVTK